MLSPRDARAPGIDLHSDRRLLLAGDHHIADARNCRQRLRQNGVRVGIELIFRHRVRMDGIDQDRAVGRISFLIRRRRRQGLRQQPARSIDFLLHLAGGGVDVDAEIELQGYRGRARARWSTSSATGRESA